MIIINWSYFSHRLVEKISFFVQEIRNHSFSTYAKFSEKLTFLTVRIRGYKMLAFGKIMRTY